MGDPRPNIIWITVHDLGRHLGCYGQERVPSPNLDRLAGEGVRFDNCFCTAPLCSPSRASAITGRYPHANGMNGLTHRGFKLHDSEAVVADYFRNADYLTCLFGLQHESDVVSRLNHEITVNAISGEPQGARDVLAKLGRFLQDRPPEPFLVSAGFTEAHRPFEQRGYRPVHPATVKVPPYLPDVRPVRKDLARLGGMIRAVDGAMGSLLEVLDRTGLKDRTLLIFTTDHGIAFPRAKSTLYDPGIGIALLMRWPGGIEGGRVIRPMVSNVDLLPTLLDIIGEPIPDVMQGDSFGDLLTGAAGEGRARVYAEKSWHGNEYDPMRCVRTECLKYIRNFAEGFLYQSPLDMRVSLSGEVVEQDRRRLRPATELYDLTDDPNEMRNLSGHNDYAAVEEELAAELAEWMQATNDPLPEKDIPWPVPGKEFFVDNMGTRGDLA